MLNRVLLLIAILFLSACDLGDSDSGAMVEPTLPGTNVPASFAGTYTGTLDVTAEALGVSESDSFDITITVTDDAMVRFEGDDPDEVFVVGLANDGTFAGNLQIQEDECSGSLATTGQVDGTTASGDVTGSGQCRVSGINVDVTLNGSFSASR